MGSFDVSGETRRQDTWDQVHALMPVALRHRMPTRATGRGKVRRLHLEPIRIPSACASGLGDYDSATTLYAANSRHLQLIGLVVFSAENFAFETGCPRGEIFVHLWVDVIAHRANGAIAKGGVPDLSMSAAKSRGPLFFRFVLSGWHRRPAYVAHRITGIENRPIPNISTLFVLICRDVFFTKQVDVRKAIQRRCSPYLAHPSDQAGLQVWDTLVIGYLIHDALRNGLLPKPVSVLQ